MGLISFVKEAGEKILEAVTGTAHAADQNELLKEHLKKNGLQDADKIDVKVEDGKAVVTGEGLSQEAKEKILIAVGNVAGIAGVEDNVTVKDTDTESQYYTVKTGDTLSGISKQVYGDANQYNKIFDANKPMLKSPDKIYPGQVLRVPK